MLQLLAYRPNGVARLGIPNLQAGEALHGVGSDGCTSFPQSKAKTISGRGSSRKENLAHPKAAGSQIGRRL